MISSLSYIWDTAKSYRVLLLLGVLIGLAQPGLTLGLSLILFVILAIRHKTQKWQDTWPYRLFVLGIGIRTGIIGLKFLVNEMFGTGLSIFGDSQMNLEQAVVAYRVLSGSVFWQQSETATLHVGNYGYSLTHWLFGMIYLLFGWSEFLLLVLNSLASCLAALLIYMISMRIHGHKLAARWAMGLALFFPSLILWSVEFLKEPVIQLYLASIIYLFIIITEKRRWIYLIPLVIACYPLGYIRKETHMIIIGVIGLASIFVIPRSVKRSVLFLLILITVVAVKLGTTGISEKYHLAQDRVIGFQIGFITTGGSWYRFIPERFTVQDRSPQMTPAEFSASFVKALGYYMMTPIPSLKLSFNKIFSLPQMLIWYFLAIICFVPGTLYLLRYQFRKSVIVIIYLLVFTSIWALFTGNEGTAFRQRDVLTIFYFIPMTIGFYNLSGWLFVRLEHRLSRQPTQDV